MSAYVVQEQTISRIVTFLHAAGQARQGIMCMLAHAVKEFGPLDTRKQRQELAAKMHTLNVEAVEARYSNPTDLIPENEYQYRDIQCPSPTQALKSLSCWLYQCSEGDIPETSTLYIRFREFESRLAMAIVGATPEYRAAEWG